jgi:hypothetical protein
MDTEYLELSKAHESRAAIERLYIEMRHIFNSGSFKPNGISGKFITEALLTLSPEIYGSLNDLQKVELNGLIYVIERLPKGIEECRYIKFTSEEGYQNTNFGVIIPPKRRRNCYRIDQSQMVIEVTRGRSEIYDVLTHLTFLYHEANKIRGNAFNEHGHKSREWEKLEQIIAGEIEITEQNQDAAFTYLSSLLGRTFEETKQMQQRLNENKNSNNGLFSTVYWLGQLAYEEEFLQRDKEITFTPTLRERIGRHIYGEKWARNIKTALLNAKLFDRPVHIISANLHSLMNTIYAHPALRNTFKEPKTISEIALELSKSENEQLNQRVKKYALGHGMLSLSDESGTNLSIQIFDTAQLDLEDISEEININKEYLQQEKPVIVVMDYAFGEQAYETMDELLKPLKTDNTQYLMPVASISIMGKAGILEGQKGDIMIPTAHVFEGTADNYPFENDFKKEDFKNQGIDVYEGPMISVLGTSLQNRDVLDYFKNSSWQAIGLEMEGAHYQKAIQAEVKIRKNIKEDVVLRYAYYASDNPLVTGGTLASGSLGLVGVKPTYLITIQILSKIFAPKNYTPAKNNGKENAVKSK